MTSQVVAVRQQRGEHSRRTRRIRVRSLDSLTAPRGVNLTVPVICHSGHLRRVLSSSRAVLGGASAAPTLRSSGSVTTG